MLGIVDIDVEQRKSNSNYLDCKANPELESRMLSLDDYLEIAKRCIGYFTEKSLARDMIRNEDALSYVAHHLMQSDARWDGVTGNIRGYRATCARWAIMRWIRESKNKRNVRMTSLNRDLVGRNNSGSRMQLYENIADPKAREPFDELYDSEETERQDAKEQIAHLLNNSSLTSREKECIQFKFYDGLTYKQIGVKLSVSGSRAEQNVKEALRKMKRHV